MDNQVIVTPEQLDREWLNRVLTRSGELKEGAIREFRVRPLRSDNSSVVILELDYSEDARGERPASLLLKLCGGEHSPDFGPSEVYYYTRDYVGLADAPLVKCYDAAYSQEQRRYHLLLQDDLTATHATNWDNVAVGAYNLPVAGGLAVLHAHWWGAERLQEMPDSPLPSPTKIQKYLDYNLTGHDSLLVGAGGEFEQTELEMANQILTHHPARMLARATDPRGFTLVHGDTNPGNILSPLSGQGRTYLLDRQPFDWSLTTWLGVSDLAYLLVLWLEPDLRRKLELKVLQHYHQGLLAQGIRDYSWEQLREDYKLVVAQCIYVPTEWCIDEKERTNRRWLWTMQLRRVLQAVEDWGF